MKQRFKNLLERNQWIKGIPNSLTLCNSLCGFASILLSFQIYKTVNQGSIPVFLLWSCFMILFAMVFDALDGFAARLLNAGSMHGLQMDSLADMVTFGAAPAAMAVALTDAVDTDISCNYFIVICILCGVYLGCAALRLATYNVHAILEKKSSERFSGLPSPGAAAALCSLVVFSATAQDILPLGCVVKVLPYYAAVLGLLMVSKIPYMHFAKWIVSCKRNKRRLAFLLFLFAAWAASGFAYHFFFGKYNWYAFPALVINIYVFWGPIAYFAVKMGILSSVRLEENA